MTKYNILINDRNYESFSISDTVNLDNIDFNINPLESKLFSNDIFTLDDNNRVKLEQSSIRSGISLPGVLILSGNKTYGRQYKTNDKQTSSNKKVGKLLYKCVPDDSHLPAFLIPYEIKNIGFSKVLQNLYVTFVFDEWEDKHPRAKLDNVIGQVDVLDNFYEYQLFCKSLNVSIHKFHKDTNKAIDNNCHNEIIESVKIKYPNIHDRTDQKLWHIITIDPYNSTDFDDGFSIIHHENGTQQLSIYISNVTIIMDVLNLWDSFSRRVSTIYLPDKKRPMLPTILSDCLCSLQENVTRVAFVMDIFIKNDEIIDIKYTNALIRVYKNYRYEEPKLLANIKYIDILTLTHRLSVTKPYNQVKNSHDVVSYLMILMNFHCAKKLISYKTGIFRSTIMKKDVEVPNCLPEDVKMFIKIWNSSAGQYINGAEIVNTRHELLNMDAYIHITSPIRRLVDLLNMIKLQFITGILPHSEIIDKFYTKWIAEIDYINKTMRSIRKVQTDSVLLDMCHKCPENIDQIYDAYLFDKITKNDGFFQYVVFIPQLKLTSRITISDNIENFTQIKVKLYLFDDEEKFKRKIRLQYLPQSIGLFQPLPPWRPS
jgi:exoribonuclease R